MPTDIEIKVNGHEVTIVLRTTEPESPAAHLPHKPGDHQPIEVPFSGHQTPPVSKTGP